jgi:pyrroloquinoline-quinone synthase
MRADILQDPELTASGPAWSPADFEAKLRERGRSYHIHHPFNQMLNSGRATQEQVRGWVANRFYYQRRGGAVELP